VITLVFSVRRLPSLSHEEFATYWRDNHGPLVQSLAEPLRIRRYEQLHVLPGPGTDALTGIRGVTESFDGVASLWFDSEGDVLAAADSAEGRRAARTLLEDERRFIDLERSAIALYEPIHFV
jgi:uncharacterized protein (TIGR02118 family)